MTIDEAKTILDSLAEKGLPLTVPERELATKLCKKLDLPIVPVKVPPWAVLDLHSAILKHIPYISREVMQNQYIITY